jgi:hypothetical protein
MGPSWFPSDQVTVSATEKEQAKEAVTELEELVSKLDPRLKDYSTSMLSALKVFADGRKDGESDEDFMGRLRRKWKEAMDQRQILMDQPEIMEELLG